MFSELTLVIFSRTVGWNLTRRPRRILPHPPPNQPIMAGKSYRSVPPGISPPLPLEVFASVLDFTYRAPTVAILAQTGGACRHSLPPAAPGVAPRCAALPTDANIGAGSLAARWVRTLCPQIDVVQHLQACVFLFFSHSPTLSQ